MDRGCCVITLLIDGLIAVVKICDRGMTAVEQGVRHRDSPLPVDDVQPAGAGTPPSAAGTGGHPIRSTSALLYEAEGQLGWLCQGNPSAVIRTLRDELRDRAANLAACGD